MLSSPCLSCNAAGGAGWRAAKVLSNSKRDRRPGMLSRGWAKPISVSSRPGAISACTCNGGRRCPVDVSGCSPACNPSASNVCAATQVRPGGSKNASICAWLKRCPATLLLPGNDTGSMPINCRRCCSCPLSTTRPCTTGDTGQPARRSSANSAWGKLAASGATRLAWGSPPINWLARA